MCHSAVPHDMCMCELSFNYSVCNSLWFLNLRIHVFYQFWKIFTYFQTVLHFLCSHFLELQVYVRLYHIIPHLKNIYFLFFTIFFCDTFCIIFSDISPNSLIVSPARSFTHSWNFKFQVYYMCVCVCVCVCIKDLQDRWRLARHFYMQAVWRE